MEAALLVPRGSLVKLREPPNSPVLLVEIKYLTEAGRWAHEKPDASATGYMRKSHSAF